MKRAHCPATPAHFLDAGKLLAKGTSREDKHEGHRLIELSLPYLLHTKQKPTTPGGPYRMSCPAAGPSPTVTCPRREQRQATPPTGRRTVIKKADARSFERSSDALPRTSPTPPPADPSAWPPVCRFDSVTFQPGDNDKLRQAHPHGSSTWQAHYQAVRGQNEGGNGTNKDIDIDISDHKRRRVRGTVALTLQLAVQLMVANLAQLHTWLISHPRDNNSHHKHVTTDTTPEHTQDPVTRLAAGPTMPTGPPPTD